MKAGQIRVRTRPPIPELRKDVRLRHGQTAVPEFLFRRAPGRLLNLAQEDGHGPDPGLHRFT